MDHHKGKLDDKYNINILKYFKCCDQYLENIESELHVCAAMQYIKFMTILNGRKLRIHVHDKTDLDQRLSIHYIKKFFEISDNQIDIITWPDYIVKETNEYDLVIDICVDKSFKHKNILIFDHHRGESQNTIEQLSVTIDPTIPPNLVRYVDRSYDPSSDIFQPMHIYFLKDFTCSEIIEIFKTNVEYTSIDRFKHKDLYRRWKERTHKNKRTIHLIKQYIHETQYGLVCITTKDMYNANVLSLHHLGCEYYINLRYIDKDKTTVVVMAKEGTTINHDILSMLFGWSMDTYVYPDVSMAMIGSTYSRSKYIQSDINTVYERLCKVIGIKPMSCEELKELI